MRRRCEVVVGACTVVGITGVLLVDRLRSARFRIACEHGGSVAAEASSTTQITQFSLAYRTMKMAWSPTHISLAKSLGRTLAW